MNALALLSLARQNDNYSPSPFAPFVEFVVISRSGNTMAAVIAANLLRREGFAVETQFRGSFKKQMARAEKLAQSTITIG